MRHREIIPTDDHQTAHANRRVTAQINLRQGHWAQVERDPEKVPKLAALRNEVKRAAEDSTLHRVYRVFNDLHEFEVEATKSLAELRRHLDQRQAHAVPPPARRTSAYLRQVARIAPPNLIGRDSELVELADFCCAPANDASDLWDANQYSWWRAPAWSGKSALMATFVLRSSPKLDGRARIVSFFVTARLAGQDTRAAFIAALLPQLADLTGQDAPFASDEADRDAQLLELLNQAAGACQDAGERLVLVVDGLDEDRSVTTGSRAHSIAGLLPARPPAGMRIIVAGRPNPPIPDDVEPWHPLRNPRIVRPLSPSDYARGLRQRAEQELRALLTGSPIQQDLLGLLTAARGGLSGPDLHELTDAPLWEIEDSLHTVSGRTFTRRVSAFQSNTRTEVYLLGHEELHTASCRYLGKRRLTGYRDRLHAWLDRYRAGGWPADSPEYLLSGYFRMLTSTGDLGRVVGCALDPARHDRMLNATGGDAAALAETRVALDLLAQADSFDLATALRLVHRRDDLTNRNINVPVALPAVWATLGDVGRAHALAASLPDPADQAAALSHAAVELATAGHADDASTLAAAATALARSVTNSRQQVPVLAAVSRVWAMTGDVDAAIDSARGITDPYQQTSALKDAAEALTTVGRIDDATALARAITAPRQKVSALARVAATVVTAGRIDDATALVRHITEPYWQAFALKEAAEALITTGHIDAAIALARAITEPYWQAFALKEAAEALITTGHTDAATALARAIGDPKIRLDTLTTATRALAAEGRHDDAVILAAEVETLADSLIIPPYERVRALATVVRALVAAGRSIDAVELANETETLTHSFRESTLQEYALAAAAEAVAVSGRVDHAVALARSMNSRHERDRVLAAVVETSALAGHLTVAATIAHSITDRDRRESTLATAALTLARIGRTDGAAALVSSITDQYRREAVVSTVVKKLATATGHVDAAVILSRLIRVPDRRALALKEAAHKSVMAGDVDSAALLAHEITDPYRQVPVLATVVQALAADGRSHNAATLAAKAETLARSTEPHQQAPTLAAVVQALIAVGDIDNAVRVARSIGDPRQQASALAEVAQALATTGQTDQAAALAAEAETRARSAPDPYKQASALAAVAQALTEAGHTDQAATLAGEAETRARLNSHPYRQASMLAAVARVLATAGHMDHGVTLAADAETHARAITDPLVQTFALTEVAEAWAVGGRSDDAVRTVRSVPEGQHKMDVLATVARTLAAAGSADHAVILVAEVESAVSSLANTHHDMPDVVARNQASALAQAAEALVTAGRMRQAVALATDAATHARAVTRPGMKALPLAKAAKASALVGQTDHAVTLAAEAESLAVSTLSAPMRSRVLSAVAEAFLGAGHIERAVTVALAITDPDQQASIITNIVNVLVSSGKAAKAVDLAVVASRACQWHTVAGLFLRLDASVADVILELGLRSRPS